MKNRLASVLAFAVLSGGTLFSQNIVGTWQGELKPPNGGSGLRTVIKISRNDDESLKAVFYSIDQNPTPLTATSCTLKGSALKMTFNQLNGTFEGTFSQGGNSITGTWSQGGPSLSLNFERATPETAWTIPAPPPPPTPMAANADPTFAVATIKPSDPNQPGKLFTRQGQDLKTINTTLNDLIIYAYGLHPKQIIGAPSWADSNKFDVTGRPDTPGSPSSAQQKIMFQKLLADRFQLKFHKEKKELSAYTITVLKGGAKLKESAPESPFRMLFGPGGPGGGVAFNVGQATLADVAGTLQAVVLDKPVVDQTGLTGKFDFILKFTPDGSQLTGLGPRPPAAAEPNPDAPPDVFAAFEQQLGLKLESTKAQVDVLVIDKVEKPSAN
jgi:uncharacterized protein (TIGR03435 family)